VLISAHAGYPEWLDSGADFIEVDVRRNDDGIFIVSHDPPKVGIEYATLDEVIEGAQGRIGLQLDLKESGYEIELVKRCAPENLVITTEDIESIRRIKQGFPQVRCGLTARTVERTEADFVSIDQQYVTDEHYPVPIWVWTVDDEKLMERFIADPRVECLITNRPDLAIKLRSARS
jgi:glycerophosphoryl diester phosphodiesterase